MDALRTHQHPETGDGRGIVLLIAAAAVVIHLATATHYGYMDDEMYYLDCSRHLAAGYVDLPPFIALVAWLVRHTLGTSLLALRLLPALASGALAILTASLAREMGARRWAQAVAAIAVVVDPMLMLWSHMLTMNALEPVFWVGAAWCVARIFVRNQPRMWLAVGAILGFGLLNKYTIILWAGGLLLGMALTPARRWFASGWFWAGCFLATLIFLPNVLWQFQHHLPFLNHLRRLHAVQGPGHGPVLFTAVQAVVNGPLLFPVWLAGLVWLLRSSSARPFRAFGWLFLAVFAFLLLKGAKDYYLMAAYPLVFAAGAVAWEQWLDGAEGRSIQGFLKPAYVVVLVLESALVAPFTLPLLSYQAYLNYLGGLGKLVPHVLRPQGAPKLPVYFDTEIGWPGLAQEVSRAYLTVPAADRPQTAVLVDSYEEAAALDFFGGRYQLPQVISGEISYWYWGPRDYSGDSVLVVGSNAAAASRFWGDVRVVGTISMEQRPDYSQILLCHAPRQSLQAMWPQMQGW